MQEKDGKGGGVGRGKRAGYFSILSFTDTEVRFNSCRCLLC